MKLVLRGALRFICYCLVLYAGGTLAETYTTQGDKPLQVRISKLGINRISNPPYRIIQVTGDDSKFRIKYDEDGSNIYLMPLSEVGTDIEVSIKNNAGFVQDLELQVADIRGRSIIIDGKARSTQASLSEKRDISQMLRAMKDNKSGKFYVQNIKQSFTTFPNIGDLSVEQIKTYKYKDLIGGVFKITNLAKEKLTLDVSIFAKNFDNVRSSYPKSVVISPKSTATVLIVQKLIEEQGGAND